jgi:outer membrane protein assembly factor BamB
MYRDSADLHSVAVVAFGGHIRGIDPATGKESWRIDLFESAMTVRLDVRGELLFALARTELFCIHVETGEVRWRHAIEGMGSLQNSSLLVVGTCVIVAGAGETRGFSAVDGTPQWRNRYRGEGTGAVALAGDGRVAQADRVE